jgi:hypothetical protein
MGDMHLPNEEKNWKGIEARRRKHIQVAEQCWDLALTFLKGGDVIGVGKTENFNLVIAGATAKVLRLYYSTVLLARRGMGNEAQVFVRAMFELLVHLKAMQATEDKAEYARQWLVWSLSNYGKQVHKLVKLNPSLGPAFKEWNEKQEEMKQDISGNWGDFVMYGPTKTRLDKRVVDLDEKVPGHRLAASYQSMYTAVSAPLHGYDLTDHVWPKEDGHIEMRLSPTDHLIETVIAIAVNFLVNTLDLINDLAELKRENLVKELVILMQQIAPKQGETDEIIEEGL